MNFSQIESNLYLFHNVSAPVNFLATRKFSKAIVISGLVMMFFLWSIVFKAQRRQDNKKNAIKRRTLNLLLGNILFSIATGFWVACMLLIDGVDPKICKWNGKFGSSLYGMSNFFVYCLLLKRAKAVENSSLGSFNRTIFTAVYITVKIGTSLVPFVAITALFVSNGKTYFKQEVCIHYTDATMSWLFMCLDTILSSVYLLLFLLPVFANVDLIKSSKVKPLDQRKPSVKLSKSNAAKVRATAKWNLQLSSVAIGSTMIFLAGAALTSQLTSGDETALVPFLHLLNWSYYAGPIDSGINSTCILLMFKGLWTTQPKKISNKGTKTARILYSGGKRTTNDIIAGSNIQVREPLFPDDEEV